MSKNNKTFKNSEVRIYGQGLMVFTQKNPIAYEISRATKAFKPVYDKFTEEEQDLISKYITKDVHGDSVKDSDSKYGLKISNAEDEITFNKEYKALLNKEVKVSIKGIDVQKKMVDREGKPSATLLSCISDFYNASQINVLEEIGVIYNLD